MSQTHRELARRLSQAGLGAHLRLHGVLRARGLDLLQQLCGYAWSVCACNCAGGPIWC